MKLTARLQLDQTQSYRVLIESIMPAWGKESMGQTTAILSMKIRTRNAAKEDDGWMRAEAEILEGRYEVDSKERPLRLAGQRLSYSHGPLRRISRWQRLSSVPTGLELLEIGPPKGRIKPGETWQLEVKQLLLLQQEEITIKKLYVFAGMQELAGIDCAKLQVQIPATTMTLTTGANFDFGGSGEVWISRKDGGVLKATEIIEGQLRDERISPEAGRLAQAIIMVDDIRGGGLLVPILTGSPTGASTASQKAAAETRAAEIDAVPTVIPETGATPKSRPAPAVAEPGAKDIKKPEIIPATTEKKAMERIAYVSDATGIFQVWSVAPDGSDKVCLTGFDFAHWNQAFIGSGAKMACVSRRGNGTNVWMYDLSAGKRTKLTDFSEDEDISIGWASQGKRLIMLRSGQLWSLNEDGFNMQSYSINGRVVDISTVSRSDKAAPVINILNQKKIVIVEVMSGTVRELFAGDLVSWSPDGSKFAFRGTDGLNIAQGDGSVMRKIVKAKIADAPIIWDGTGQRIAFTIESEEGLNVVSTRTEVGSSLTKVTSKGGQAVTFSPAGDRIAYLKNGDLWIVTADGKVHMRITSDGATHLPVHWGKHVVP